MTLEDALRLIARRGRLISACRADRCSRSWRRPRRSSASWAAMCRWRRSTRRAFAVLSGPDAAIDAGRNRADAAIDRDAPPAHVARVSLVDDGPDPRRVRGRWSRGFTLSPPSIPFAATLTGDWANGDVIAARLLERAVALHGPLRRRGAHRRARGRPARQGHASFWRSVRAIRSSTFAAETAQNGGAPAPCLTSLPGPHDRRTGHRGHARTRSDSCGRAARSSTGRVSTAPSAGGGSACRPIRSSAKATGSARRPGQPPTAQREARDTSNWFHRPGLARGRVARRRPTSLAGRRILVFDEGTGLGAAVVDAPSAAGARADRGAASGVRSTRLATTTTRSIPRSRTASSALAARRVRDRQPPGRRHRLLERRAAGDTDLDTAGVVTLLAPDAAGARAQRPDHRPSAAAAAGRRGARAASHDDDPLDPPRALGLGRRARSSRRSTPGMRVAHLDVDDDASVAGDPDRGARRRRAGARRWRFAPASGSSRPTSRCSFATSRPRQDLPEHPVVLVTGGLGHMGIILAEGLFSSARRAAGRWSAARRCRIPTSGQAAQRGPATPRRTTHAARRLARMHAERDDVLVSTRT